MAGMYILQRLSARLLKDTVFPASPLPQNRYNPISLLVFCQLSFSLPSTIIGTLLIFLGYHLESFCFRAVLLPVLHRHKTTELWNRITESLRLEKTSQIIKSSPQNHRIIQVPHCQTRSKRVSGSDLLSSSPDPFAVRSPAPFLKAFQKGVSMLFPVLPFTVRWGCLRLSYHFTASHQIPR